LVFGVIRPGAETSRARKGPVDESMMPTDHRDELLPVHGAVRTATSSPISQVQVRAKEAPVEERAVEAGEVAGVRDECARGKRKGTTMRCRSSLASECPVAASTISPKA
jgi:hypothetical protein